MKVAIVIPCFNVSRSIEEVVRTLPDVVDWIITINDHSTDNTEQILQDLGKVNSRVIYVHHSENQGVGAAVISGYEKAVELGADIIVKMDGDGQMDPNYLSSLIKPIIEGKADFTKGNRFRDLQALREMPLVRRIGNLGLSFLIKAASGYWNIFDPTNGYSAIAKEKLKEINFKKISKRYFFESSLLIELYHTDAVVSDVSMKARYGDESSGLSASHAFFTFPPKLFRAFIRRIVLKYFLFDFNIASIYIILGIPLFLTGSLYGVINFFRYASHDVPAPTGTVVIPALLIILGFQLLLSAAEYDLNNYPKRN